MSTPLAELEEALGLANGLLATKYLAAASLACVAYDSMLLLEKEFHFIWRRSSLDTTGLIYLLIRYCNLAGLLYAAYGATYYNPIVDACLLSQKPIAMIGVWAAMSTFDISILVLGISNALHQPYKQNIEVMMRFRRDGAIFFIAVFVLRLINLVCSIVLQTEYLLVNLFFVWGMVSITTCRLILRVEEIRHNANRHARYRTYELGEWRSHNTASLQQELQS
ncbi:hypothetical protein PsYK624_161720 [Phanerochaete sordida]|uniref:DUF6533 domain-containing protein n=1 Tax=Phanerochaete sordida TaxID=48140 RepID=A0A9P3LN36_9APHY|nr:hypothetical protein PsYK624_161720 [Phanerochaete sordida]